MKRVLALVLALMMVLTACTGGSGKTEETSAEAQQEYRTLYSGEVTTLNYLKTATTNEFALAANLVDTLIDYDKYGVIQPCLATEWSVSDDGLVWTLRLREGVKWVTHEGK